MAISIVSHPSSGSSTGDQTTGTSENTVKTEINGAAVATQTTTPETDSVSDAALPGNQHTADDWINDLHPEDDASLDNNQTTQTSANLSKQDDSSFPQDVAVENIYIKADREAQEAAKVVQDPTTPTENTVADTDIFSSDSEQIPPKTDDILTSTASDANNIADDSGFDIDDLVGEDTPSTINQSAETTAKEAATDPAQTLEKEQEAKQSQDTQNPGDTIQPAAKKPVGVASAAGKGLKIGIFVGVAFILLISVWFVLSTMFPLGLSNTHTSAPDEITNITSPSIDADTMIETNGEDQLHDSAGIDYSSIIMELEDYIATALAFYELGREHRNSHVVRYALYIEKKSERLIDALVSGSDIDIREIEFHFDEFDDYLNMMYEREDDLRPAQTTIIEYTDDDPEPTIIYQDGFDTVDESTGLFDEFINTGQVSDGQDDSQMIETGFDQSIDATDG